jgi:hypothetical protein
VAEWGPQEFQDRLGTSLQSFVESTRKWLQVERGHGRDAVERVYQATLQGSARPDQGNVLSLWDDERAAAGS